MSELDALVHPRSIALVGLPRGMKAGKVFLLGLLDQQFAGPIYPVHPQAAEIDGLRAYPRILDVPDPLDEVIVMAPRETVPGILEECAAKRVKVVVVYTSGFGESGDEAGRREERRLKELAVKGGFRLLGPNCMGVYSPAAGLANFPGLSRTPGPVGLLSQSGSLTNLFTSLCSSRGIHFRHAVSYGNGCDVDLPDLLTWMGEDPDVGVLCIYCEGVRDGGALAAACRSLAGRKPVIIWKTGETAAGRRAAASHTGSLSGQARLWRSLFRQCGWSRVQDIEGMLDLTTAFCNVPLSARGRVVVVSGPGGPAVSAADAAERAGLEMAVLGRETRARLAAVLPPTGTSIRNPVDVGLSASFDLRLYLDSLEALAADREVDVLAVLGGGATAELSETYIQGLVDLRRKSGKAVLAVTLPGYLTDETLLEPLYHAGVPVYPTPERALRAYAEVVRFARFREARREHAPAA
ncbi:MAG: CoA-binding protein [bacterium]